MLPVPVPTTAQHLDFLIAGVQKGGTTALAEHLMMGSPFVCLTHHPTLAHKGKDVRELHAEDHRFDSIQRLNNFTLGRVRGIGCNRTSPRTRFGAEDPLFSYFASGRLLDRVSSLAPRLKIILLLREPVQRAFSQYEVSRFVRSASIKLSSVCLFSAYDHY